MKTTAKPRNTKRRTKSALPSAKLVCAKTPLVRHLRLIEHKHTGKLISHRHTSHVALLLILATVGLFIYATSQVVSWATTTVSSGGSVTVNTYVKGPPPTTGAVILAPTNNTTLSSASTITVSGSCASETFVVVYDNQSLAGSTSCTSAGVFSLEIQLNDGNNQLTALNFDNMNQAGPTTPSVLVIVKIVQANPAKPDSSAASVQPPQPTLPINPSIISGVTTNIANCNDYVPPANLKTGGIPHIEFVCVPRLIDPLVVQPLGILAWGGQPPYAISLSLGVDNENSIVSMSAPGYKTVGVKYSVAGFFNVRATMVDINGRSTVASTSIQVNGTTGTPNAALNIGNDIQNSIINSTVPIYIIAVAVTLGFWGGDIFDRKFGARSNSSRKHRAAH